MGLSDFLKPRVHPPNEPPGWKQPDNRRFWPHDKKDTEPRGYRDRVDDDYDNYRRNKEAK
jgi:hypothetical protein